MSALEPNPHWCEGLYEAQAAALILYGRALGLSHSESEDVVHEVFKNLLHRESAPNQPENYLVRAFRNTALNYKRSFFRRILREWESKRWFEAAEGETDSERKAMECLATLPQEQREVIVLKFWHSRTFDEIADLLDLSPNTVAGRFRYGMQKLRACLNSLSPDPHHEQHEWVEHALYVLDTPPAVRRA